MERERLERLCAASNAKFFVPERDVPWEAAGPADAPVLPAEVLSLHGIAAGEEVAPEHLRALARHELASIFSTFIRFESSLNENLERVIQGRSATDPLARYLTHVVEEECRHSRMFARLVEVAGAGSYPRRGIFGWIERVGRRVVAASDSLSFLGMLAVEEVTDSLIARILASRPADPRVVAVCRIHRVEEARHMELARTLLREQYRAAGRLQRLMLRNLAPLLLHLVFDLLVPPDVYRQAGISGSRSASWRLWWRCRRTRERRALCREGAGRMRDLLTDLGAMDAQTRLVWGAVGLGG